MPIKDIDYDKVKERAKVLILGFDDPIRVKFLHNGKVQDDYEIDDNDGNKKKVNRYIYDVLDLDDNEKSKELSFLAITFVDSIEPYNPIENKSFQISKYQIERGNKFKIGFKIVSLD